MPDGARWIYTLRGSGVANVASDYIGLKAIKHNTQGTLDISYLEEGENFEADGLLTGSDPTQAYLWRERVAFDAIMSGTEMIDDVDDRTFTSDTGNWTNSDSDNTFAVASGQGRLTIGATPTTSLLALTTGVDDLTVGRWYVLTLDFAYSGAWAGGIITVTIDGQTGTATLTTAMTALVIKFQATSTNPDITITCATAPTVGNIMLIDNVSLQESPIVFFYYGEPPALTGDSDSPVYPLNLTGFTPLVVMAAKLVYADEENDISLYDLWKEEFERLYREFSRFIEVKGKQYAQVSARAHRL